MKILKDGVLGFAVILLITCFAAKQAKALEFLNYKDAVKTSEVSEADLEALWSKTPVCIKDGAKIKAVNKLFKAANLGYRDCSTSDKVQRKHNKLGIMVAVIPLYALPKTIVQKLN